MSKINPMLMTKQTNFGALLSMLGSLEAHAHDHDPLVFSSDMFEALLIPSHPAILKFQTSTQGIRLPVVRLLTLALEEQIGNIYVLSKRTSKTAKSWN